MITSSFVHLPGIGPENEARLWSEGCCTWDDLTARVPNLFGKAKAAKILAALADSRAAHRALELAYFHSKLKGGERWRVVPQILLEDRAADIAYLDIETTGLGFPPATSSTTIAVLWGGKLYVEHEPRAKRELMERVDAAAKLLVTFNGTTFDLPYLRREFNLAFAQAHLDLRYWFARFGHGGGLKAIQQRFPDVHQRASMDIDGFDAVRLWQMHRRGYPRALETLMTYNAEDTIVLEQLMYLGLTLEARARPALLIPEFTAPAVTPITTRVCPEVYRVLRRGE